MTPGREGSLSSVLSQRHLPMLDGLRAVSVLTVMAYHFGLSTVPGDLGVSAFFVLSGFLITRLLMAEREHTGTISIPRFYLRRVLRIFPAYYVFLVVSYAIDWLRGAGWSPGLRVAAVLYGVNYYNAFQGMPQTSIEHAWSLAIEEQFYLLWPLTLAFLLQRGTSFATRATGLLVLAVAAWRSWLYLGAGVPHSYVYNAFDTRLDALAIGCLLALWLEAPSAVRVASTLSRRMWWPVVTLALLMLSRRGISASYHYALGFTVDAALIAVLMVQLLHWWDRAPWSWLEHPVARYLGRISYPLYLWHPWGQGLGFRLHGQPVLVQVIAGLAACIAVASGSYYVIEKPFLRLKDRFAAGAPTRVPAGSSVLAVGASAPAAR